MKFSKLLVNKYIYSSFFKLNNTFNNIYHFQRILFGSKKQKEKVDKETKKLRKLIKISDIKNESKSEPSNFKKKGIEKNEIDYKEYDERIEIIIKNFDVKINKIFDNTINIENFNNIIITKNKKDHKFSELAQIVIKSPHLVYIYPYIFNDAEKIIYSLKQKYKTFNTKINDDKQYIELIIPSITDEIKAKKLKDAKILLEKVKNDIKTLRHKIKDDINKNIEGNEWKIFEKTKLDNYIKNKIKNIETIYENVIKN